MIILPFTNMARLIGLKLIILLTSSIKYIFKELVTKKTIFFQLIGIFW